jgi:predicted HTH domain antitoxin
LKYSLDDIAEDLSPLSVAILELLKVNNKKPIKGNVAFQKEMFLISNYIDKVDERAEFVSHFLGPYSEASEVSMNNLVSMGLVEKNGNNNYKITSSGIKVLSLKQDIFSSDEIESISDFKKFISKLNNDEILLFIYVSYPDYARESTEYHRIIKSRIKNSISIYKKGIISLEKAASLAGVNIEKFLDLQRRSKLENI